MNDFPLSKHNDLVKLTPLQLYLREITQYPLLEPEEEAELAHAHHEHGDIGAAHRLVTANLRLVVKIANDYRQTQIHVLDLIQEGNHGLMQAVKRFNPYKGVKLSSYAAWWIKAYILKFIMENKSQVKIGTTRAQRKLFFNLKKEAERLLLEYEQVDPKMIAASLQVKEEEVVEMQQRLDAPHISLDDAGTEERSVLPALVQDRDTPEEIILSAQLRTKFSKELAEFCETLGGRDKEIMDNRILSDNPLTLQEIGDQYGVSRERARQLEARLIKKLRKFIVSRGVIDV